MDVIRFSKMFLEYIVIIMIRVYYVYDIENINLNFFLYCII